MLVLTRKKDEAIILGNNIEIVVLGVEGEQVKIGIKAPKNIEVHRKEIYLAIQEENKSSLNTSPTINVEDLLESFRKRDSK